MLHHFATLPGTCPFGSSASICAPFVVHADHADLQPLVARNLPQRRQPVHGRAMRANRLPVLVFQNHILPARRFAPAMSAVFCTCSSMMSK